MSATLSPGPRVLFPQDVCQHGPSCWCGLYYRPKGPGVRDYDSHVTSQWLTSRVRDREKATRLADFLAHEPDKRLHLLSGQVHEKTCRLFDPKPKRHEDNVCDCGGPYHVD